MPELLEFQEVIETHSVVLAILCGAVAVLAAIVTRWADQRTLDSAHERLTAYEEEVRRLNDERADMLGRIEERNEELRRMRGELARLAPNGGRPEIRRPEPPRPERGTPEVALPHAGGPGHAPRDPDWR
jgi:hypothetical protein